MNTVAITGNTYPVRGKLYELGGRWDAEVKAWIVPENKADEAMAIVNGTPKQTNKFRPTKCAVCGAQASRYVPIYRSGECKDCYEERKMGY